MRVSIDDAYGWVNFSDSGRTARGKTCGMRGEHKAENTSPPDTCRFSPETSLPFPEYGAGFRRPC